MMFNLEIREKSLLNVGGNRKHTSGEAGDPYNLESL